jgi:uncharacterized protein (DUF169 family)
MVKKVHNVNEPCDRIITTAECITNEMLANSWQETNYHSDVCCATNYAHIEIKNENVISYSKTEKCWDLLERVELLKKQKQI